MTDHQSITGATGTPIDGPMNLCEPPEDNNPTEHHHPENVKGVSFAFADDDRHQRAQIEADLRRHALQQATYYHSSNGSSAEPHTVADTANTFYAFLSGESVMMPEPREYTRVELFDAARRAVQDNPLAASRFGLSYTDPF